MKSQRIKIITAALAVFLGSALSPVLVKAAEEKFLVLVMYQADDCQWLNEIKTTVTLTIKDEERTKSEVTNGIGVAEFIFFLRSDTAWKSALAAAAKDGYYLWKHEGPAEQGKDKKITLRFKKSLPKKTPQPSIIEEDDGVVCDDIELE